MASQPPHDIKMRNVQF